MRAHMYTCLLSALAIVETKTMSINAPSGKTESIRCSDWNVWMNIVENDKYLCKSPCSSDKHIIIRAEYKKTRRKDRIEITNEGEVLLVTFHNLQKSDSGKYFCGVDRFGHDAFIELNVKVQEADPSSPKVPSGVPAIASPTTSSSVSAIYTTVPTFKTTLNTTTLTVAAVAPQTAGSTSHLIIGVSVVMMLLMILLMLMRRMKRKQKDASSAHVPQEETFEDDGYDEISHEDQQRQRELGRCSTLYFPADPDSVYANCSHHKDTKLVAQCNRNDSQDIYINQASSSEVCSGVACNESTAPDQQSNSVYSVVQRHKRQTKATGQSRPNQSESSDNDSFYSLAQLPPTT